VSEEPAHLAGHVGRRDDNVGAPGCREGVAVLLYAVALPKDISERGKRELASGLSFYEFQIEPADNGRPFAAQRRVHPRLERIVSRISSVGAGIALANLDGDELPNDACLVDPRNDSVTVRPLPGTGDRYLPFALPMPTAGYDPNTIAPMGCLAGDVNEDGCSDLIVYYWGRTPVAFLATARSPGPSQNRPLETEHSALMLDLRFPNANGTTRPAIGAIAGVTLRDGPHFVGQVDGGNGHSGRRAPEVHFGLGKITQWEELAVELHWRGEQGLHRSEPTPPPPYRLGSSSVMTLSSQVRDALERDR
jgi:ASPIC and UnbV